MLFKVDFLIDICSEYKLVIKLILNMDWKVMNNLII